MVFSTPGWKRRDCLLLVWMRGEDWWTAACPCAEGTWQEGQEVGQVSSRRASVSLWFPQDLQHTWLHLSSANLLRSPFLGSAAAWEEALGPPPSWETLESWWRVRAGSSAPLPPSSGFQSSVSHILICVYLQSVICGIYWIVNSQLLTAGLSSELLFWGWFSCLERIKVSLCTLKST